MEDSNVQEVPELKKIEWTPENDLAFLQTALVHRPVGINRHFQMACILESFQNHTGCAVPSDLLWSRLNEMYDIKLVEQKETLPFPLAEEEFALPNDYSELIEERSKIIPPEVEPERVTPKPAKEKKEYVKKKDRVPPPVEKEESSDDSDEDSPLRVEKDSGTKKKPESVKKQKIGKVVATPKRRITRSKLDEKESSPVSTSSKKAEEEGVKGSGRRSLRPRGADEKPIDSPATPAGGTPRGKRVRRI